MSLVPQSQLSPSREIAEEAGSFFNLELPSEEILQDGIGTPSGHAPLLRCLYVEVWTEGEMRVWGHTCIRGEAFPNLPLLI